MHAMLHTFMYSTNKSHSYFIIKLNVNNMHLLNGNLPTATFSAVSHSSSSPCPCLWRLYVTFAISLFTSFSAFILPLNDDIWSNLNEHNAHNRQLNMYVISSLIGICSKLSSWEHTRIAYLYSMPRIPTRALYLWRRTVGHCNAPFIFWGRQETGDNTTQKPNNIIK